jgi:hypothetical protein
MKLGVIVFFVILTFAVSFDVSTLSVNLGNFTYLMDMGSLVIVLVPTIVFAIGAYSRDTYVKTWSIPFGNPENCEQSELIEVNKCLNSMGNMSLMMGIIGSFIGVILLLNFLQQGVDLARAIAIAVVSLFYGFFFKALLCLQHQKLKNLLSSK